MGSTAVVTGGTDGIGSAIAGRLAGRGARVIIIGRNAEKGVRAETGIRASTGNSSVEFMRADLSLMRETDRLAEIINARFPVLNRLVLCAGVVRGRRVETVEGIESNFAINYLTRFALTGHLMPVLQAAGTSGAASRIVVVSGAAQNGKIYYDDVNLTRNFGIARMVSQFCEANDLFVREQARRLCDGANQGAVTITTLKVGVVKTNIRSGFPMWMRVLVPLVFDPFLAQTTEQIADSAVRLLTGPEFEGVGGALFRHIKKFRRLELPQTSEGPRLWRFTEQLLERTRSGGLRTDRLSHA